MTKNAVTSAPSNIVEAPLLIVGIGASAGGLEPLQQLFSGLTPRLGLAYVIVQHLDEESDQRFVELLSQHTAIPVSLAQEGLAPAPNAAYVAPARAQLSLQHGKFKLTPLAREGVATPIDHWLQSLAEERPSEAVGVILSGSGTDGTLGLKAISDAGGMTIAQDPATAKFESMPRSAATTGVADHVLAPEAMAQELKAYARHVKSLATKYSSEALAVEVKGAIATISELLQEATGHNFRHYKVNTLVRRIQRRMQMLRLTSVDRYLRRLRREREEVQALFRELLIGVTAFFRDQGAFSALAEEVLPHLALNRPAGEPIRVWVAGCATGEEAYTLAILLREWQETLDESIPVQLFATDIDERALAVARQGHYPLGIAEDITPQRLKRFFVKRGKRYHVVKEIRELCLFSSHNLICDPPFSRLDLIVCRNLLIYLGSHLQDKLVPVFHYALKPGGYLFLGPSENLTAHKELFRSVNARYRLFLRRPAAVHTSTLPLHQIAPRPAAMALPQEPNLTHIAQRIVLDEFSPQWAIISDELQVVELSAHASKYLQFASGSFQNNIVKLVRSGLRAGLRSALREAREVRRKVVRPHLMLRLEEGVQPVVLTVQPMPQLGEETELLMVIFQEAGPLLPRSSGDASAAVSGAGKDEAVIEQLERELATTRDDLERVVRELETANEELRSANEELLSMNEELQSANEELETSKEEIQAGNKALERANADLENLLSSAEIATIFLNEELRLQRFTPAVTAIYNLIPGDLGRPLAHITHHVKAMPPLPDPATLQAVQEAEVETMAGRWFQRRVLPYRTASGDSGGLVVTFSDITTLKQSEQALRDNELLISRQLTEIEEIYQNAPVGMCILDRELRWVRINGLLAEINGLPAEAHIGKSVRELLPAIADSAEPVLRRVLETGEPALHVEISGETPAQPGVTRHWLENWLPLRNESGEVVGISVFAEEITALKRAERFTRRVLDSLYAFVGVCLPDGTLIEANRTAIQAAGLDELAVLNRPFEETYWWSYSESVQRQLRAAIARAAQGKTSRYDVVIRVGERRFITIDFQLVPLLDEEERVTHLIPSGIDISERIAAHQRLRLDEARYRSLIEATSAIVWRADQDGTFIEPQALFERYTGFDGNAQRGWGWLDAFHPQDRPLLQRAWNRALEAGRPLEIALRLWQASAQQYRHVQLRAVPVQHSEGYFEEWIGSIADIHEAKLTEQALAASEERLRLAASAAGFGTYDVDLVNKTLYWSSELKAIMGVAPEATVSCPDDLLPAQVFGDDRDRLRQAIAASLDPKGDGRFYDEHRIVRPDHTMRWVLVSGETTFIGEGKTRRAVRSSGAVLDITERKQTERQLAIHDAVARSLAAVDAAVDPSPGLPVTVMPAILEAFSKHYGADVCEYWEYSADRQGMVGVVIQSSLTASALAPLREQFEQHAIPLGEGIIGRAWSQRTTQWLADLTFDARFNASRAALTHGLNTGFAIPILSNDRPLGVLAILSRERWSFDQRLLAALDEIGRDIGVWVERRRIEQRLQVAIEAISAALYEHAEPPDVTTYYSPRWATMLGYWPDELPPEESFLPWLYDRIHPDDSATFHATYRAFIDGDTPGYEVDVRLRHREGHWIWVRGYALAMARQEEGRVARVAGLMFDITERQRTQQALLERERSLRHALRDLEQARATAETANQAKSEFLANMSHEIRSPLSAILGYADILAARLDDPDDRQRAQTIRLNGRHLLALLNDFLDLAKIEAGKLAVAMESTAPDRLVGEVYSLMAVRAYEKGLPFYVEYNGPVPKQITTDPVRLRQILINLLSNAIKFTQHGEVRLRVAYLDEEVPRLRFDVIDTGIGLSETQQKQLFQPFTQADTSNTRRYEGTGLGLTISQRLADLLGGEITLKSQRGRGSTFTLIITIGAADEIELVEACIAQSEEELEEPPLSITGRLLVVDDRVDIRALLQYYLEQAGAEVVTAADGEAALVAITQAEADEVPFRAVIMDMQMPLLDGYQTTRRLRAKGFQRPIIALTANAMVGERDRCLQVGCTDYLVKPIDRRKLVESLKRHLPTAAPVSARGKTRVLVIDDSVDACDALATLLQLKGYQVQTAYDGQRALALAEEFVPKIIISDISLPDINGYALVTRLRALEPLAQSLFIALSGAEPGAGRDGVFDHFLLKPIELNTLLQLLQQQELQPSKDALQG